MTTPNQQAEREATACAKQNDLPPLPEPYTKAGKELAPTFAPLFSAEQMREYALQARAALSQAAPVAVPEGYALVPVEPTISMCLAGAAARISVEYPTPAEAAYRAMLAAAASNPDSKGSEIGRPDELRFGLHGDLLLRDRSAAAVAGFAGASLVDALWNSDEVMALNAELGLTMDQLVRLSRAMLAASQPPASEPANRPGEARRDRMMQTEEGRAALNAGCERLGLPPLAAPAPASEPAAQQAAEGEPSDLSWTTVRMELETSGRDDLSAWVAQQIATQPAEPSDAADKLGGEHG